jgi:hypothetical protein
VDGLLDNIAKEGLQSLSDSERRFLMKVPQPKTNHQKPA